MKYILYILFSIFVIISPVFGQSDSDFDIVTTYTYRLVGKTATGIKTTQVKEPFIAISRDLLEKYPLHSYVKISKCRWEGIYKVMDIMGSKYISTIDVYYNGKKKYNKVECLCNKLDDVNNEIKN